MSTTKNTPQKTSSRKWSKQSVVPQLPTILDNGGPFDEDVEGLHGRCVKLLGPNGLFIWPTTKNVVVNARVSTAKHGVLWYGDLDMIGKVDQLKELERLTNASIVITEG